MNEAKPKKGPSPEETVIDLKARARPWPRGNKYEDFTVGDIYEHRPGRTLTQTDNTWFTALTMNTNQVHFIREFAARTRFGRFTGCARADGRGRRYVVARHR